MIKGVRPWCVAALLLTAGCTAGRITALSPKQGFEQFSKSLTGFENAMEAAASATPADTEELAEDLRHRVGRLEEEVSELHHQTANQAEAQTVLNSMSLTVHNVRAAAEGTPNFALLREQLRMLKAQTNDLQGKL